jgi:hypothetical protein
MITYRHFTSARQFRSLRQRQRYTVVLTHILQLVSDSLDELRSAKRTAVHGVGSAQLAAAELTSRRATKLWHLQAAMAFGRQPPGKGISPCERVDALLRGDIPWLLHNVLLLVRQTRVHSRPAAAAPVIPGAQFTERDRRQHQAAADVSSQRRGISQAARMLEAREAHAPADADTERQLRSKHLPAGARSSVTDSPHAEVRSAVAAAMARVAERSSSGPTAMEVEGDTPLTAVSPLIVTAKDVLAALSRAGAGRAAGLDGQRYEHLWMALGCCGRASAVSGTEEDELVEREAPAFAESLAKIYTVLLTEPALMPEESLRLLRAAALSAIGDKRRPIACSSVWRRLLASIATRAVTAELAPVLTELSQFGVGVSAV